MTIHRRTMTPVVWDITPCIFVKFTDVSDEPAASIIYKMRQASSSSNVGTLLPEYTASRRTRLMSDLRTSICCVFLYSNTTYGDKSKFYDHIKRTVDFTCICFGVF